MKLAGYIEKIAIISFTIPIYTDGKDFFCHQLDKKFLIKNFYQTTSPIHEPQYFIKVENTDKEYNVGDPGLFVFATENEVFIETDMIKIMAYMNTIPKYELTKKEIMEVHEVIKSRQ